MGKFFVGSKDLFRVTFPDGQWVDIKKEFSQDDSDYIMNAMASAKAVEEKPQIEMNLGKMATLERAVVAWSFTIDDGTPAMINADNLSSLSAKYRMILLKEIDRLNKEAMSFLAT